jgi:hypothetical protein
MKYKNKYEASKDYDNGLKLALFHERPDGFKWEDQTPMFMFGYDFGRSMKESIFNDRNTRLQSLGIEPIYTVSVQST